MITPIDIRISKQDPFYFITNFTYTFDERNPAKPINKFPARKYFAENYAIYEYKLSGDPYLIERLIKTYHPVSEEWKINFMRMVISQRTSKIITHPKSRQLTVSWGMMAYFLYRCMFYEFQSFQILSKKETDSVYQVRRAKRMYELLPKIFQDYAPLPRPVAKQAGTVFEFSKGGVIEGFAQGEEGPRSRSSTALFLDEAQEQTYVKKVVNAAEGTNLIIMVGTANKGGEFQRYAEGTIGGD